MTQYSNLVDLLSQRAQQNPNLLVYHCLPDGETTAAQITYQNLDQQARAIAAQLQSRVAPGTRAIVVYPYPNAAEFIAAFFGCLYAGVIAVTDNPPRNPEGIAKLLTRAQSCEATIGLTTQSLLTVLKERANQMPELGALNQIPWIATDTIPLDQGSAWEHPGHLDRDTLAFLQYTSGSTGTPKGVMVTHGNMLHNSEVIRQSFEHTATSKALMWLPLYHDMGLIGGVIQPLYTGFTMTLMSPISLIQKPFRWLEVISRYQITTSGGPNFAYDLLCHRATPELLTNLDLSSWDVAFSGAEPVRAETLDRFVEIFAPCGFRREAFYPCYGMAETTLLITGGAKQSAPAVKYVDKQGLEAHRVIPVSPGVPGSQAVVACGYPWLGDELFIVDPETQVICQPDQVGEIWVRGAGVGQGYWQKPEETERTFRAMAKDGAGTLHGPFLRTGDLGFWQDEEVYITGRIKELMILWGRNHYPQHIEQTVENAHPDLRPNSGAAFAIEVEGEEHLVIVHEVKRQALKTLNVAEIVGAIRQAVGEQHLADIFAIVLIKTGTIPKTSSGKIQRGVCRTQFLEGSLNKVGEWQASVADQEQFLQMLGQ